MLKVFTQMVIAWASMTLFHMPISTLMEADGNLVAGTWTKRAIIDVHLFSLLLLLDLVTWSEDVAITSVKPIIIGALGAPWYLVTSTWANEGMYEFNYNATNIILNTILLYTM